MAYTPASSTFPLAKTNLNSPEATSDTGEFDHAGLETAQNSAIDKLETAVGVTDSEDTDSLTYKLTSSSQSNPGHKHTLAQGASNVTATLAEVNVLDGITATTEELNKLDGVVTIVEEAKTQTLTNKTLTSPIITGTPTFDSTALPVIYPGSMSRQAIINGNFDVWQRGTSNTTFADGIAYFLADRWYDTANDDGGTKPTITRSRQSLTVGDISNAFYFSRLAVDGAGSSLGNSSYHWFAQKIEHATRLLCGDGKKVTVSFWARSDIANKRLGISLQQNYGSGGSPSAAEMIITQAPIAISSTWTKYTVTFTTNTLVGKTFGTANDDLLRVNFAYQWGTTTGNSTVYPSVTAETYGGAGYIDIAQVQLCAGDVALPFMPKSFDDELRACQRYFEKSWPYATAVATAGNTGATISVGLAGATTIGHIAWISVPFKVEKRTTPTIAIYDVAGTVTKVSLIDSGTTPTNGIAGTAVAASSQFTVYATATAATQRGLALHWTADAEL